MWILIYHLQLSFTFLQWTETFLYNETGTVFTNARLIISSTRINNKLIVQLKLLRIKNFGKGLRGDYPIIEGLFL